MTQTADAVPVASSDLRTDLAIANQILFDHYLNDGFGHVTVRHDRDPNRYVMLRDLVPGVMEPDATIEFDLESRPIPERAGDCREKFIHGEIYKRRPEVMAIVHTHAAPLVLFSVLHEKLRPIYHMSYFLGSGAPVFEMREFEGHSDLLIKSAARGRALATTLGHDGVVLMRGHGATVVGASLKEAIYRTIYSVQNAQLQTDASRFGRATFLSDEEVALCTTTYDKAWLFWKQRALRG